MRISSERYGALRLAVLTMVPILMALSTSSAAANYDEGIEVRILIYSGRTNPSFTLDDAEEIGELRSLVGALRANPTFERSSVLPSILGYAGIIVINRTDAEGLPKHLAVYREDVETSAEGRSFLRDPSRRLEGWLVERFIERDLLDRQALELIGGPGGQRAELKTGSVSPRETRDAPYPPDEIDPDFIPNIEEERWDPVPDGPLRGDMQPTNPAVEIKEAEIERDDPKDRKDS